MFTSYSIPLLWYNLNVLINILCVLFVNIFFFAHQGCEYGDKQIGCTRYMCLHGTNLDEGCCDTCNISARATTSSIVARDETHSPTSSGRPMTSSADARGSPTGVDALTPSTSQQSTSIHSQPAVESLTTFLPAQSSRRNGEDLPHLGSDDLTNRFSKTLTLILMYYYLNRCSLFKINVID